MQSTAHGETAPKKPKTMLSAKKVIISVFWDMRGIIMIGFLEKESTITCQHYVQHLDQLEDAVRMIIKCRKSKN